jgi:hypothetical protein
MSDLSMGKDVFRVLLVERLAVHWGAAQPSVVYLHVQQCADA